MLRLEALQKSFNGFVATNGVSLDVSEGERHAIIGPNGAGKSTLFNLITGHLRPDSGTVRYRGEDITGLEPHVIVRKGVSRSFQHTNVYPKLTVFENMQCALIAHHRMEYRLFTLVKGLFRDEALGLLASVGMEEDAGQVAGTLAYGRQKQLELAVGLASDPAFLLLDEPTAGMSGRETHRTIDLIATLAEERRLSLLFTEHDMKVVFEIADRISVLHLGRILCTGAPSEVRSDPEVKRVYLGGGGHGAARAGGD
jgi:branched-chain amino acid transport system ATP-binding protein